MREIETTDSKYRKRATNESPNDNLGFQMDGKNSNPDRLIQSYRYLTLGESPFLSVLRFTGLGSLYRVRRSLIRHSMENPFKFKVWHSFSHYNMV